MSYLHFDKTLMINLEESLPREILRTNKSGAYHCTTIVDCNTRKYHGLLVIPVPNLDDENHVLLSSLDETVIQHGAEFNLGLHKYQGNHFSPNGHKYIREFDCEHIPATTYRVGGVILRKEKIFVHHENRILIRYTLVDAHSATTLRFRPFLAFRSVREYTHENSQASRDYQLVENGIKTCMYPGYPELFMQLNKKNEFHYEPNWYKGIEYPKEQERGYDFNEDLYVPGYFEVDIKKGESIIFSAGISEISPRRLKQTFEAEVADRTPRDSFYHCLKNSAHQFHNKQEEDHYILAGYPWFKCRARDMFVSLPGLTLAVDEIGEFEDVMETARKGYWKASPEQLSNIAKLHTDLVRQFGPSGSGFTGDNAKLQQFIASQVDAQTAANYNKELKQMKQATLDGEATKGGMVLKKQSSDAVQGAQEEQNSLNGGLIAGIVLVAFVVMLLILKKKRKK